MNQYSHFAIEKSDVIRPQSEVDANQWKLLRRLRLPDKFNDPKEGTIKRAMVIDVETTGLSTENDDVIQLAMLPFDYYEVKSGRILTFHKALAFEELREPAVPISEEASIVVGHIRCSPVGTRGPHRVPGYIPWSLARQTTPTRSIRPIHGGIQCRSNLVVDHEAGLSDEMPRPTFSSTPEYRPAIQRSHRRQEFSTLQVHRRPSRWSPKGHDHLQEGANDAKHRAGAAFLPTVRLGAQCRSDGRQVPLACRPRTLKLYLSVPPKGGYSRPRSHARPGADRRSVWPCAAACSAPNG